MFPQPIKDHRPVQTSIRFSISQFVLHMKDSFQEELMILLVQWLIDVNCLHFWGDLGIYFQGLALAAVGFRYRMALARLALAVRLVLLVLQLRRPDSPEMLALRLQQETQFEV